MEYVCVSPALGTRNSNHRPASGRPRLDAAPRLIAIGLLALLHTLLLSTPSHAARLPNGTTVNGTTVNGTTVNGTTVNGTTVNGTTVNGTTVNGMTVNGTTVNGTTVNGTTVNGTTVNGTTVNGTTVNGTTVNGTTVNGTTVNGTTVNGTTVNGTTVNGTTVNGMTLAAYSAPHDQISDMETKHDRLTGFQIDRRTGQPRAVRIRHFHGDVVDALLWTPERGRHERMLPAFELVGMQWRELRCTSPRQCVPVQYRVIDGERDASRSTMPAHADNHDIWLFELQHTTVAEPTERDWQSFCQPDRHQQTRGMFLDGQWRADGSWDPRGYTFACTNGVLAKCARNWGYKPWKHLTAPGGERVSLQPLHQACTRAARADYCGDGISHTRNGTLIDLFDRHGLNVREQVPGFQVEAGFTTRGASWIARPRFARGDEARGANIQLATCARPRQVLPASQDDALVYVWSRPRTLARE